MSMIKRHNSERAAVQASKTWPRCEELIRQFEFASQRRESPSIDAYLQAAPHDREALVIELIHIDLEFRLKAREQVRVEAYLQRFPELARDDELVFGLLGAEYRLRRALGESISLAEYKLRFPQFSDTEWRRLATEVETDFGADLSSSTTVPIPNIPGYEILAEIGRGGMGVIYQARDPKLDRIVALKFLPGEYSRDSERLQRFLHEARTASALNHPNICTVHALGEHNDRPFIVLEFIEGVTLRSWAAEHPELRDVVPVIGQAVRALSAAHAAGIIHRDIKPDNIMLRPDGYVKVVDFGLARSAPHSNKDETDTTPGAVFGTAAYMSPEQTRGEPLDWASDIFSLGIVLYQLATGRHPFESGTIAGVMHAIATLEPVLPSAINPAIPQQLEDLIASMLQKERLLRPNAAEILETLNRQLEFAAPRTAANSDSYVLHRDAELAVLNDALSRANLGTGSMVCVSGEPGIGKTTLIDDFLEAVQMDWPQCTVLSGHCSERLAGTEAYLPVIEALGNLCRDDRAGTAARHIQVLAPTWHAQLATTLNLSPVDAIIPPRAVSPQGMLREFSQLLTELTRRGPVVLFIDDMHWADVSTVNLLSRIGTLCRTVRLLIVMAYRPTELLIGPHPFHQVKLELQTKGICRELALGFFDREQVSRFLVQMFPNNDFPADFLEFLLSRTEGSPLFIAELLRYLRERSILAEQEGRWSLAQTPPDLQRDLPDSVRGMIERKLKYLNHEDLRLLTAASVQGQEFDSAVVAEAIGMSPAVAEERLESLERVHGLVRQVREMELSDHTLSIRYTFVHGLYQQALYAKAPPTRRASLALDLVQSLQSHHTKDCPVVANELACLLEVGRDFRNAAYQFSLAAQHAVLLFAHREAVVLARHGLRLVAKLAHSPDRLALELPLQTMLGLQLQVTLGFAAPAARAAYSRALELCPVPHTVDSYPVLWGLWLHSKVRSELDVALELARELEALALRAGANDLILQSQQALSVTSLCRGDPHETIKRMERALSLYDVERHQSHSFLFGQDPAVACQAFGAVALCLTGNSGLAQQHSRSALALGYKLMQPSSQVLALHFAAMVHQLCGEPEETRICAELAGSIAAEHNFAFWHAGSLVMRGWATVISGTQKTGIALLRQGLSDWEATGSLTYKTYYLGLLAEALIKQGDYQEASKIVESALQLAEATHEHFYLGHLHILRSQIGDFTC